MWVPDDLPKIYKERISVAPCFFDIFPWLSFKHHFTLSVRLTPYLCLRHIFCFICQHICPSSVRCRLLVLRLRWCRPFCLLSSPKDEEEQRFAVSGAVGGVQSSESLEVCAIEKDDFLTGTRVLSAFEKVESSYLKKEIRWNFSRRCLEDFVNCVLSTVAARSVIGHGLSCFCPPILLAGDNYAPMQQFGVLLDRLLEESWVRGAQMEACKSEYQLFVPEQRQLQQISTRSHSDIGNVLTICSSQAGFRAICIKYVLCPNM